MIRLNNKPSSFELAIPYSALLEVESIPNLKEGFGMLGMRFSGQPRKAQIVESYDKYIKTHPKEVLRTLSPDSLTLLNELLKKGKGGNVTIEGIEVFNQLQKTNLVVTWENEADNVSYLYLLEEIFDLFEPLIEEALNTPVDYSSITAKNPLDAVVYELMTKCKEITGDINKFMKRKNIDTLTEKELDYYEDGLQKHNAALTKYTGKLTSLVNSNPDGFGGWEELIKVAMAYVNQVQALIDENRDKLASRRQALNNHEEAKGLPEFQKILSALSFEDLQSLANEATMLLDKKENLSAPHLEAIISELQKRTEHLKQDSESLKQQISAAEQRVAEQNRECNRLKHEVHHLQQKTAYEELQARKIQTTGSFTPRRNDPCPCGSGKKYKHCCGK